MKTSFTHHALLYTFSALALAIAGIWGFLLYEASSYRAETATLSQATAEALRNDSYSASLMNALRGVSGTIESLDGWFIDESDVPRFISRLEAKAKAAGVDLDIGSVSLESAGEDMGGLKALKLRLAGRGSWVNVVGFVSTLESMKSALRVDAMSLRSGAGGWQSSIDVVQLVTPSK
jgi:hypothetical protein